jgi:uncharacterized protein (DUF2062 family)
MWLRLWKVRQRKIRLSLKKTSIHQVFGKHIYQADLWKVNRQSLSRGLALGLFIAFTPTIPFQMLLTATAAIYFKRLNLPIALAACWVTNPLTAIPIYMNAEKLGKFLLEGSGWISSLLVILLGAEPGIWIVRSMRVLLGSLVFAFLAALIGYFVMGTLWSVTHRGHDRNKEGPNGGPIE